MDWFSKVLLAALIIMMIAYSIIGYFTLSTAEVGEMLISTVLFMLIMGFVRNKMLGINKENAAEPILVGTLFFLNWYFLTHFATNSVNTHSSYYNEDDQFVMKD